MENAITVSGSFRVYGLVDPVTDALKYVGATTDPATKMLGGEIRKPTSMDTSKRQPSYGDEFRLSVVRKVLEEGQRQVDVARETGVKEKRVNKWVTLARKGQLSGYVPVAFEEATGDLAAEVKRLRRELETSKLEISFLKKVSAFFAKQTP